MKKYTNINPHSLAHLLLRSSPGHGSACEAVGHTILLDLAKGRVYLPENHGHDGNRGMIALACGELASAAAQISVKINTLESSFEQR